MPMLPNAPLPQIHARKHKMGPDVDLEQLAKDLPGLSGGRTGWVGGGGGCAVTCLSVAEGAMQRLCPASQHWRLNVLAPALLPLALPACLQALS